VKLYVCQPKLFHSVIIPVNNDEHYTHHATNIHSDGWVKWAEYGLTYRTDTVQIILIFKANILTGTKHPAILTDHLANINKTKRNTIKYTILQHNIAMLSTDSLQIQNYWAWNLLVTEAVSNLEKRILKTRHIQKKQERRSSYILRKSVKMIFGAYWVSSLVGS